MTEAVFAVFSANLDRVKSESEGQVIQAGR